MVKEEQHPELEKKKFEIVPIIMRVSLMCFALASIVIFKTSLSAKKPTRPNIIVPATR